MPPLSAVDCGWLLSMDTQWSIHDSAMIAAWRSCSRSACEADHQGSRRPWYGEQDPGQSKLVGGADAPGMVSRLLVQ